MSGPLAHLLVLDLSRVLAGPWASQNLADMGARVIKVEHPRRGDDTRHWGPPWLGEKEALDSAYFIAANRGKESVAVDMASLEGQALLHAIAAKADVVIENFKPGALQKYRLDYASLSALNPRLVYCSITGFGQTGPWRDKPGYDYMIQALGGLMSITGMSDGAGGEPMRVGVPVADLMTGMVATQAILGAVIARDTPGSVTQGKGQAIDLSLYEAQLSMLANQASGWLVSGEVPGRIGNAHPMIVPYQLFRTKDVPLILAVGNDAQFNACCEALELIELADDERFMTNRERVMHRGTLVAMMQERLLQKTADAWLELLQEAQVPCGRVQNVAEALTHPQAVARGIVVKAAHASGEEATFLRSPIHYSGTPLDAPSAPPQLGQHTEAVRKEFMPK